MAEKKVTKDDDLFWTFIRSNFLLGSFNFERMQAIGFCVSMMPILKRLYEGDELKAALKRHLEFFNTQPFVAAAIMGIIGAMEEKKANGADISAATLSGVKVGLIGPLAGVGDPIFWGTVRPVLAALGAGIALTGSLLGPIIMQFVLQLIGMAFSTAMRKVQSWLRISAATKCTSSQKALPFSVCSLWVPSLLNGQP